MTPICVGTTRYRRPCRANSERGYRTCPPHRAQENLEPAGSLSIELPRPSETIDSGVMSYDALMSLLKTNIKAAKASRQHTI